MLNIEIITVSVKIAEKDFLKTFFNEAVWNINEDAENAKYLTISIVRIFNFALLLPLEQLFIILPYCVLQPTLTTHKYKSMRTQFKKPSCTN